MATTQCTGLTKLFSTRAPAHATRAIGKPCKAALYHSVESGPRSHAPGTIFVQT